MFLPLRLLAALAAILSVWPQAHAQPADTGHATSAVVCPEQPRYPLPQAEPELRALAARLDAVSAEPGCLKDAFFHAWRGAVLMALGDNAAAIEPLERALMTRPDLPAAQLDLALALAATGERRSAVALLAQLRERTDLPDSVRVGLEGLKRVQDQPVTSNWQSRWQLSSLVGAESNLNNAPSATELTLTLPQGNVTLPLATSSLPKRGAAVLNALQWQGLRASGASLWLLQAEARARSTGDSATNYQQADVAATWLQAPQAASQWVARAGMTHLRFGGRALLHADKAAVQYQWPRLPALGASRVGAALAACRPAAGLELENRRYPVTRELDGHYGGGVVALLCSAGQAPTASLLSLQLRTGQDRPRDAVRPGGTETRSELRAQWDGPLASPWPGVLGPGRLGLQWTSAWQSDASGYSPLLENNAVRRITRHGLQAQASFALGGGLSAVANAEASLQRSNLPAFGSRQRSLYLGLRWELM